MIVRVKKNIKIKDSFIPYNDPRWPGAGASINDYMLELRGREIKVEEDEPEGWYNGIDNDWEWHRSWFVIPRKKNEIQIKRT